MARLSVLSTLQLLVQRSVCNQIRMCAQACRIKYSTGRPSQGEAVLPLGGGEKMFDQ